MEVETVVVGVFQANCFVVWAEPHEAIVIDPGADADEILEVLHANRLAVALYLLTHGHVDHLSGLTDMVEAVPAPVAIPSKDASWCFEEVNQMPPFYGVPRRPPHIDRLLEDGLEYSDGGMAWEVVATPGHTPGSACIRFPDAHALFSGDTLFAGSVGRTDLPGGDPRALTASLERIARLPGDMTIYPGHGPTTRLSDELRTNFYMRARPATT